MKTPKLKLALLAICCFLVVPPVSHAAVKGVAMTNNTALFLIKFDFVAGKEDYRIPIGALQGLDFESTSTFAGYKVFSGKKESKNIEKTAGIILSKQPIVDGLYYKIPAGQQAHFTLVSLVTVPKDTTVGTYHTELSHMPYKDGDTWTKVSKNDLGKFYSDSVLLNNHIISKTYILQAK
jgi:hypothetical protein